MSIAAPESGLGSIGTGLPIKGKHSQIRTFFKREKVWRDEHFATNFIKIGEAIS